MKKQVYLDIAKSISQLSKDTNTQVGAVIVDKEGKVVSLGYNGAASTLNDNVVPHTKEAQKIRLDVDGFEDYLSDDEIYIDVNNKKFILYEENKYPFMLHAEQNAILTATDRSRLVDATLYVTHFPCNVCSNMVAQVGITKVVCASETTNSFNSYFKNSLFILQNAGIEVEMENK